MDLSFILSHSLTKLPWWLQRCFPFSKTWPLPTAPAGKTCPVLSLCLWAHAPELGQENTASTLVQRKELPEQGRPGLTWRGLSSPSKARGGPGAGGILHPPMHISPQASYHGHLRTHLLPLSAQEGDPLSSTGWDLPSWVS